MTVTQRREDAAQPKWLERSRVAGPRNLVLLGVTAVIAYLALVPLGYLVWGTLWEAGRLSASAFERAYTGPLGLGGLAYNTAVFTIGATVVSVFVGVTLAYITQRTDVAFRRTIIMGALIPLIIPGILYTISWIFLASPNIGILTTVLEPLLGPRALNVFSMTGMILVQGLDNSPLVFLLMLAAFWSMDPSLEESALMSGARLPTVVRKVTLPMVKPAVYAAVLIMAVRNVEAFETPALLGMPAGQWVLTSRVWRTMSQFPPDYGAAGAYSLTLLVVTSLGVYFYSRFNRRAKEFQTVTGKGFRPQPVSLGKWRMPISVMVLGYMVVAIVLPVLTLLYMSLQPYYTVPSLEAFNNITLGNYEYVLTHRRTTTALTNSFVLAIGAGTAVMIITAVASWLVVRSQIRGAWVVDNLAFVPLVIPGLVLGVGLLFVYLRFPIAIYGTLWILFIAYCTRALPYGMRYATTSMYQIGGELEESAHMSGASWLQTFRRVNVPLLMPGLMAGWLYIVMTSVRELSSSILLYSPGNEVLAVMIWEQYEDGQFSYLAALGMLLIGLLVVLVAVVQQLNRRVGIQVQ